MFKTKKIEFINESNNLSIESVIFSTRPAAINIVIGAYIAGMRGDDGEVIMMEQDEFEDFIAECEKLLSYIKSLPKAGRKESE